MQSVSFVAKRDGGWIRFALWLFLATAAVDSESVRAASDEAAFPDPLLFEARPGAADRVHLSSEPARIRLPIVFGATGPRRVSWDAPVSLDLRTSSGLSFLVRCPDGRPVQSFMLYLKSGSGWYTRRLHLLCDGNWHELTVTKGDTRVERQPEGWGNIERVRFSAWKMTTGTTHVDLGGFKAVPCTRRVIAIRGIGAGADANAVQYAGNICRALRPFGIRPSLLNYGDVTASGLAKQDVVICPFNPGMPARVRKLLRDYIQSGGHVIGFYVASADVVADLGFRYGVFKQNPAGENRFARIAFNARRPPLVPQLIEQDSWNIATVYPDTDDALVSAWWQNAAGARTPFPAVVASSKGMWMSHVLLNTAPDRGGTMVLGMIGAYAPRVLREAAQYTTATAGTLPFSDSGRRGRSVLANLVTRHGRGRDALERGIALRQKALAGLQQGQAVRALTHARQAQRSFEDAYYQVQRPRTNEWRGAWLHDPSGVSGWEWDRTARQLAESGFHAMLPNVAWATTCAYPSNHIIQTSEMDQLEACTEAGRRHGIKVHAWKIMFKLGPQTPADVLERLEADGRLQIGYNGELDRDWLCPSHPANRRLEVAVAGELAARPVAGVHLDTVRFPGHGSCFCPVCRRRFESELGYDVRNWPDIVRNDADLKRAWEAFRRGTITSLVGQIRERVKETRASCALSAAVFGDPWIARNRVAQDWSAWCRDGLLDFVCPMTYTGNPARFADLLRRQRQALKDAVTPVHTGIGVTTDALRPSEVIHQVNILRAQGMAGFTLFEMDREQAVNLLPALGQGLTRRR